MRDIRAMLIALLLATPFGCWPKDRGPASPPRGSAGGSVGPQAPATTEPPVPGVPNAESDSVSLASRAIVQITAIGAVSRPQPSGGGTSGEGGDDSGTGGSGTGGIFY